MMGATSFVNVTWRVAVFAGACAASACVITTAPAAMLAATQPLLRPLISCPLLKTTTCQNGGFTRSFAYILRLLGRGIQFIVARNLPLYREKPDVESIPSRHRLPIRSLEPAGCQRAGVAL